VRASCNDAVASSSGAGEQIGTATGTFATGSSSQRVPVQLERIVPILYRRNAHDDANVVQWMGSPYGFT
jgi:hypothetical protein